LPVLRGYYLSRKPTRNLIHRDNMVADRISACRGGAFQVGNDELSLGDQAWLLEWIEFGEELQAKLVAGPRLNDD
jgi:hypothetical protein